VFEDLPPDEVCPYDRGELATVTDRSLFDEHTGRVYADKYRIGRVLGAGGMGCVHEAVNLRLDQPVAVKFFSPRFVASTRRAGGEASERFRREATIMARTRHANVVRVLDFAVETDGTMLLVMELLEGEPLDTLLSRGGLTVEQALGLMLQVLKALDYVHEQGVVHRDLKPSNVFCAEVGERYVVKVLDFGIARLAGTDTITDGPLGTWRYAAPEQLAGAAVKPTADIFSAGIILHEMLAGGPKSQRELGPDVPDCLREVVTRSTAQAPDDRYSSSRDMLAAIEGALDHLDEAERLRELPVPGVLEDAPIEPAPAEAPRGNVDATPVVARIGDAGAAAERSRPPSAERAGTGAARGTTRRRWRVAVLAAAACVLVGGGWLVASLGAHEPPVRPAADAAPRAVVVAAPRDAEVRDSTGADAAPHADAGPPPVKITFVSTPRGAQVLLLGEEGAERELCTTSCLHEIARDPHPVKVVFRHPQYEDTPAELVADQDRIVEVTLRKRSAASVGVVSPGRPHDGATTPGKGMGFLSVRAIPQSDVFLDGRRLGKSPINRREVAAGTHQLRLVPRREVLGPGVSRPPKTIVVTISPGQTKTVVEYW
jgi:serine/threonine-protein kinase